MLSKYKYTEKEQKELLKTMVVVWDSREQKNSHIIDVYDKKKIPHKKMAMKNGDYTFMLPANKDFNIERDIYFDSEIIIERKNSLDELSGSLSTTRANFEKELATFKGKMTLMIEQASYKDLCEGNYNTKLNKSSFKGTLHAMSNRYGLGFIFINKEYSADYIYNSFYYYLRELIK